MNTYWISFVENSHSPRAKSLGCCIVDGDDPELALQRASNLGINPGGEAMLFPITNDSPDLFFFKRDTFISAEELKEIGYSQFADIPEEKWKDAAGKFDTICEKCNKVH